MPLAEDFRAAVVGVPGALSGDVRAAIARRARAPAAGGPPDPPSDVPGPLLPYVEKVAHHAYRVMDEDVAALKAAGLSEDAIFEATASAALGAALARLERGLAALGGGDRS
jgi:hypothetical protein